MEEYRLPKREDIMSADHAMKLYSDWRAEKGVGGYFKLYNGFVKTAYDKKLNKSETLVYLLLCECSQNETGLVVRTTQRLSELSGIPKSTIDNVLTSLEEKGMIFRETFRSSEGYSSRKIVILPYIPE